MDMADPPQRLLEPESRSVSAAAFGETVEPRRDRQP